MTEEAEFSARPERYNPVAPKNNFINPKGYNGNVKLKRTQEVIEWTPELIVEYTRCATDVEYFVRTYMKIISVDDGLIPFQLYDYQSKIVLSIMENRYTVVTTARQAGKSTSVVAGLLHMLLFRSNQTIGLLANKADTAQEILGRIQLAYMHLPAFLQQGVVTWNKRSFVLENNSKIIAAATSSNSARGFTFNTVFIDEAAHIENWDEFFTSVYPTISSGKTTKLILVSTPKGLNHFYKLWTEAMDGRNDYKPIMVTWDMVPGRDEAWKEATLRAMNGDKEKFAQEMECEFQGSSGTLIAGWKLKQLVHSTPIFAKDGLTKYADPAPKHIYCLIADCSQGRGLDYSTFQVIDVTSMPYRQACIFRSNLVAPADYAEVINRVGRSYNTATVLVETNNMGQSVSDALYNEFEYENMLFTMSAGSKGKKITAGFGKNVDRGINTSTAVKAQGCSMLKLLVEQDQLVVEDVDTIAELSTFSKKGKSYEAEPGNYDDMAMCLVLFGWLSNQKYFTEFTDVNTLMRLREVSEEQMNADMVPFGFVDDGRVEEHPAVIDEVARHWMGMDDWG